MNIITTTSQPSENGISFKDMVIYVSDSKNETTHTTGYEYLCFINGKQVLEIGAMKQYTPEELYDMYLKGEKEKSDRQTRVDEANNMAIKDKARFMRGYILDYIRVDEGHYEPLDITVLRQKYPDINLYLDTMIYSAANWEAISYEEAIKRYFTLDEAAKKYVKTSGAEGIDMSKIELAEKVGDLYYDALAVVLSKMADVLKRDHLQYMELGEGEGSPTDPNTLDKLTLKASQGLQEASSHIMTAWEICKPYLKVPLNPKHTTDIQGIPNPILGERVGKLNYGKLSEFLEILAQKLHKDGLADEGRGRTKLSNELFVAAKLIQVAGEDLSGISRASL